MSVLIPFQAGQQLTFNARLTLKGYTPVKCLIEASFLLPVSFKISCALIPCSLKHQSIMSQICPWRSSTHSSTECECRGELLPSIAGAAKDRIEVVESDRNGESRDVDAALDSIGRSVVGIIVSDEMDYSR